MNITQIKVMMNKVGKPNHKIICNHIKLCVKKFKHKTYTNEKKLNYVKVVFM